MKRRILTRILTRTLIRGLLLLQMLLLSTSRRSAAQPAPADSAAFHTYIQSTEARLAEQHRSAENFLAAPEGRPDAEARLRGGELLIERLSPAFTPGASHSLLHHWRGTAFAPGATAADFDRLMRNVGAYPVRFAPQVIQARVLVQAGDRMTVSMRLRQRHVVTVVLDTDYEIVFSRLDARHGSSLSRSTRIVEIGSAGTAAEHALTPEQDHGFLWRLNTYWSYAEGDGGLYLQVEAVSLTRSIPTGTAWAVRPYVESIPRESLAFTLRSVCNAVRNER